jgi:hypothetical protein
MMSGFEIPQAELLVHTEMFERATRRLPIVRSLTGEHKMSRFPCA